MIIFTHLAASFLLYAFLPSQYIFQGSLLMLVAGTLFPEFDNVIGIHRRSFHFPFLYPLVGFMSLIFNQYLLSIFFLSAGLHSLMELLSENVSSLGSEGAVYNHITGARLTGLGWIETGTLTDIAVMTGLSAISIVLDIRLIDVVGTNIVLGIFYFSIRNHLKRNFPGYIP